MFYVLLQFNAFDDYCIFHSDIKIALLPFTMSPQSTNVPSSQPTPCPPTLTMQRTTMPGVMNNNHSPSFLQDPPGTAPIMNISSITTPTRTPIRVTTSQTHSFVHGISHSPNAAPERDPHGSPNEIPTPVIPTPVIVYPLLTSPIGTKRSRKRRMQ